MSSFEICMYLSLESIRIWPEVSARDKDLEISMCV